MEIKEMKIGGRYLLSDYCSTRNISELTVLESTEKAFKIKWNISGYEFWETKERLTDKYKVFEELPNNQSKPTTP